MLLWVTGSLLLFRIMFTLPSRSSGRERREDITQVHTFHPTFSQHAPGGHHQRAQHAAGFGGSWQAAAVAPRGQVRGEA